MGKKFKFKLDGLLKLREFKENQIKVELGNIVRQMQETKNKIIELDTHIDEAYKSQEDVLSDDSNGDMLKFYPYFIKGKKSAIDIEENKLKQLQERYQEKIKEMAVARGETKVLDKFKEKEHTKFKKDKMKSEYQKIEEMSIIRSGTGGKI